MLFMQITDDDDDHDIRISEISLKKKKNPTTNLIRFFVHCIKNFIKIYNLNKLFNDSSDIICVYVHMCVLVFINSISMYIIHITIVRLLYLYDKYHRYTVK